MRLGGRIVHVVVATPMIEAKGGPFFCYAFLNSLSMLSLNLWLLAACKPVHRNWRRKVCGCVWLTLFACVCVWVCVCATRAITIIAMLLVLRPVLLLMMTMMTRMAINCSWSACAWQTTVAQYLGTLSRSAGEWTKKERSRCVGGASWAMARSARSLRFK